MHVGNSPGYLTLNDVLLGAQSTLFMEIENTGVAGVDYDHVTFIGAIDLSEVIMDLDLLPGYLPVQGDRFSLFDFSAATLLGGFEDLLLPTLDTGLRWETTDLYTDGLLLVAEDDSAPGTGVPLPGALWLIAIGWLVMGWRLGCRSHACGPGQ